MSNKVRKPFGYPTIGAAIEAANLKGFPYSVQAWANESHPTEYVVAHGSGDGIGKTVYATLKPAPKRWCNVTATVEIMVEIPLGTYITPKEFEKHIETGMWKHVSNLRVIAETIE